MSDLHIDDFYKNCALIFKRLFHSFPQKCILYVEDIVGPDQPDDFGLHSPSFLNGFSAMLWLAEEGYIRYEETIKQEALDQVVLTQRGFLLLSQFSSVENKGQAEVNIRHIRAALNDKNSSAIEVIMQSLLRN